MANRFFIVGGVNTNTNSVLNWSTTSGGLGGASVPTNVDDAIFDGNSGTAVTINAIVVHSWNASAGGAINFGGTGTVSCGGQAGDTSAAVFTLASGQTWSGTGNITWDNRGSGLTITTAGVSLSTVGTMTTGTNNTGQVTLSGNMNIGVTNWTHNRGILLVGSNTLTCTGIFATAGANTKTISYSGGVLNCTTWTMGGTLANLTITGNSSSQLNTGATTFTGGAKSYPGVVSKALGNALGTIGDTGNTFVDFTATGTGPLATLDVSNFTVTGLFTLTGSSNLAYMNVIGGTDSNAAAVTLTLNGTASVSNCTFRGVTIAGSLGTLTGSGGMGNRGNNSGITFTGATTRYYIASTSGNFHDNRWATSSGGSVGASAPLPGDTAVFNDAGVTANTLTFTMGGTWWPVIDTSTLTRTATNLAATTGGKVAVIQICGNITLSSTVTLTAQTTNTVNAQFYKPGSTITVATNGGSIICTGTASFRAYSAVATSGVCNFGTAPFFILGGGSLDLSNNDVSIGTVQDGSGGGSVTFGAHNYTLAGAGTVFNMNTAGSSVTGSASAQFITSSGSPKTMQLTVNAGTALTLYVVRNPSPSSGALTFAGSGNVTILAPANGTQFIGTSGITIGLGWMHCGPGPSNVVISSSTPGSQFSFSKTTGIINIDRATIQDCHGIGGAVFYSGGSSTLVSNTTGWSGAGPMLNALTTMGAGS